MISRARFERSRRIPLGYVYSVLLIILIILCALMVMLNLSKERGRDETVRSNLESIAIQARIRSGVEGSYGRANEDACVSGVFTDPTIQAALVAIRSANGYAPVRCVTRTDAFLVIADRPARGFYTPNTPYWCVDAGEYACALDALPQSDAKTCGC